MSEDTETTRLLPTADPPAADVKSEKKLGLVTCVSMTMSMTIGVGIFVFPNLVLREIGSGGACLVLWGVAGFVAILGGLAYSELAVRLPGTGAEFVYLQNVYKDWIANLYLYTSAFIKYPAISVIMAQASVTYIVQCISSDIKLDSTSLTLSAILLTVITCIVVSISTKISTTIINVLNSCKLFGLVGIISFAILVTVKSPNKEEILRRYNFENTTTEVNTIFVSFFGSIASYEGWNTLNVVAGEVNNPQTTIPIATTVAVVLTTTLYISANAAYFAVLPLDVMKNSKAVALDLGMMALGSYGKIFLTVCVVCSALATVIALVICNSRLIQKAARQKQLPEIFTLSHCHTGTPIFSIILHGLVVCLFTLLTSIEFMTTIIIVISWIFYFLCFLAVIILRYRDRVIPSFKVPLAIPCILIVFSILLVFTPASKPGAYLLAFVITLVLLALLTPLAVISSLQSARCQTFSQLNSRVTNWVIECWNFV